VNTLRWIPNGVNAENELVSGSVDAKIIVWRKKEDIWEAVNVISDQKESITNISVLTDYDTGACYIASTSTEGSVMIFRRDSNGTTSCLIIS
jgi:hypothetical protein